MRRRRGPVDPGPSTRPATWWSSYCQIVTRVRRYGKVLVAVILAVALVGLAACDDDDEAATTTSAPTTTSPAPTTTEATTVVTIYLFGEEERLVPTERTVSAADPARGAIEALLAGPDETDEGTERGTLIPEGTKLLGLRMDGDVLEVDLSRDFESGGGSLSMRGRVAQFVYTATDLPGVTGIRLLLDGEPVEAVGGEGVIVEDPQTRNGFEDFAPEG